MTLGFRLAAQSRWCPSTADRSPSWPGPHTSWPGLTGLTRPSATKRRSVPRVADGRVKPGHDVGEPVRDEGEPVRHVGGLGHDVGGRDSDGRGHCRDRLGRST
jgi:hypothetical protein